MMRLVNLIAFAISLVTLIIAAQEREPKRTANNDPLMSEPATAEPIVVYPAVSAEAALPLAYIATLLRRRPGHARPSAIPN